ncbi:unnamed protein product [Brugia timori]|uniref:G protein gamma domain-containing protein n=1 Tax=Brugia timori TaxID=42155 RepID=A0A0R3QM53_9BILA|nr:unnamed protein product [Brugia timori]
MPPALVSIPLLSCQVNGNLNDIALCYLTLMRHFGIDSKFIFFIFYSLIEYCEREKQHDMLVSGPIDNHNPFQEKKSCAVL